MPAPRPAFHVEPAYADALRDAPTWVFTDPRVVPWRTLPDRDNATLDLPDGTRLHVKRHKAVSASPTPAEVEVGGLKLLTNAGIPTLDIVAWGVLADGRSFTATRDLAGYTSGQVHLRNGGGGGGGGFDDLLLPTAHLAADLHARGLHHRDLYLCHFFLAFAPALSATSPSAVPHASAPTAPRNPSAPRTTSPVVTDCRLIDVARVARLPRFLARRWVVKDLAQFWYSAAGEFGVPDHKLLAWLDAYAARRNIRASSLVSSVRTKAARIARHDANLKLAQPTRNVSLPTP